MNNTIAFTGHHNRFPVTTTTTTTTTSYGPGAYGPTGGNHCSGSNAYNPANSNGGIQLSSKAQMLMRFMGMMGQLAGGPFGELMSALGVGPNADCGQMQGFPNSHPGFGPAGSCGSTCGGPQGVGNMSMQDFINMRKQQFAQRRAAARAGQAQNTGAAIIDNSKAPQAPRGQATEMKAGQTMKAPNGSLVSWGQDGNVGIKYKDANGQLRTIDVKDGMMRMDGGKPQKLENVGQLLKLPNGDVIGLGNNPQGPNGKQLCRVVMADNADQIKTEPASATNIYDIKNMQHTETGIVPTYTRMNVSGQNYNGFCGGNSWNAQFESFHGEPYRIQYTVQDMTLVGRR